ncbi:hypothetical protein [Delftia phage PhiW-14]|uniref:Uncharacterized protein n=1 Tax=Delftia phage PhiW-14 TaxID=665032 RepID=C9DG42_BPW14|nr:hypothetical protein DP-phiW-14_gp071 [Delftia phage PhiW-14]ACV50093.1 hypothetical protein [Delftia phage PhiW-14]
MGDLIHYLVFTQVKYKLAHWYASDYQVHLATDKFNDSAGGLFDEIVETVRSVDKTPLDAFQADVPTFDHKSLEALKADVGRDIEVCKNHEARSMPIIASQLDQLGAYLSVLFNNLSMIKE